MKKRILFVQDKLAFGGTSSLILFIAKNLSDIYTFDLLCYSDNQPELEKEFLKYGGKIIKNKKIACKNGIFGKTRLYLLRLFGLITKYCKKSIFSTNETYYAIHCFEEYMSAYYLKASKKIGIDRRIVHFCNDHLERRKSNIINSLLRRKEYRMLNNYSTSFAGDSVKSFPSQLNGKAKKIIADPIDEKFSFSEKTPAHLSLIQVGLVCDNKNQMFSLSIFKHVHDKLNNAKLIIAGQIRDENIAYFSSLQEYIKRNELTESVCFVPPTLHLNKLFEENTFLIFPSKKESFGMVLIEAQACGMYCFSSKAASPGTDLGGVCYLSLDTTAEEWAKRIIDKYSETRGKKIAYDVSEHSPNVVAEEFRRLYEN